MDQQPDSHNQISKPHSESPSLKIELPKDERIRTLLTPKERASYWTAIKNNPLSPARQAQLFELFLNGNSTETIANLNKMPLGEVVRARIDFDWDQKKDEHVAYLLSSVRDRVRQIQLESITFSADLLAAAHKLHGERIRKFIQTGDEAELGDLKITNLKAYKDAVELLLKLTGQDKDASATTQIVVQGNGKQTVRVDDSVEVKNGIWTAEEAAEVLKLIELKEKK